jgi:hypothetical protein
MADDDEFLAELEAESKEFDKVPFQNPLTEQVIDC